MKRQSLLGALGAVVLLGAGCGIPAGSDVRVDGKGGAATGAGVVDLRSGEPPKRTSSGSDNEMFVRNFLSAAAGEPDRAYERVKAFVAPESKSRLQDKKGSEVALNVVRLGEAVYTLNSDNTTTVKITVQQIGVLRANGVLAPPVATETEYEFRLRSAALDGGANDERAGLYVVDPPNVLLLSDVALKQYYQDESIYFWSSDRSRLVPDQRYRPLAVPSERRVNEVVKWLVGGPSDWLRPGVVGLPDRTELINNATGADSRWEVNLDMSGDDRNGIDQLITQLAWSLGDLTGELELKIRNNPQPVQDLDERRTAQQLYPNADIPQRFGVYEGAIHPLDFQGELSGTVPLAPEANRNIVSADLAVAKDRRILAAMITTGSSNGRYRLSVGSGAAPVTGVSRSDTEHTSMSRPVWLRTADTRAGRGLVVADGQLYRFDEAARMYQVPLNLPSGNVTAVAAALDGQRVALIAGGRLYVAAVNLDGGGVSIGPPRQLATSLTGLTAVDWGREDRLVVAGSAGQQAIYEISVDGALETPLRTDVGAKVNHLTAYPTNRTVRAPSGAYMYEANGVAYRSGPFERIEPERVRDIAPVPAGVRPSNPSAPFFLY
ncbi:LpqB family beta-propeller domain-containing protein [Micromonospora sp. WMMC250]|uniref:LpqB family beta-propeller domain-containing protein n=1 Tax=Micromonospora sp. WMMC250 TaxID=3014781 RepID=UPI0022B60F8F|nr:LpqB family beta-propeller domain-containing protein [Micromonospora sp. WMMC250]MCZ7376759.1 LpqB family beta-propeller domain-containing protein [Micromonospora sp. WMMC250]